MKEQQDGFLFDPGPGLSLREAGGPCKFSGPDRPNSQTKDNPEQIPCNKRFHLGNQKDG